VLDLASTIEFATGEWRLLTSLMAEGFTPDEQPAEPAAVARPSRRRRLGKRLGRWRWPLLALAALLLVLILIALFRALLGPEVPVAVATRRDLEVRVVATGRVQPVSTVVIAGKVAGQVVSLEVDDGDRVERGALLARLDDEQPAAAVEQAQAAVAEARARFERQRQVASEQSSAELRQARVSLRSAQRQLARIERLFQAGAATAQELDDARSAVLDARARVESAEAQARSDEPSGSDYRAAAASLEQAEARLAEAQARLADTRITAPVAGEVLDAAIAAGDTVQPGQVLFELAERGSTFILTRPDEKNLRLLATGQKARVSADAFPNEQFEAVVHSIAPAVDEQRGTVEVELKVPEPPDYLRTNMTVSVDILAAHKEDALVLPSAAVRGEDTGEPYVLQVRGNRVRRRGLELGVPGEGMVEVVSGLSPGDLVVLPEAGGVEPGDRVRPRWVED
jgi:HlyD family secretion protein